MEPKVEFKVRKSQVRWLEQAYMSQNTDAGMAFWNDMCHTKLVRVNLVQLNWLINKLENKAQAHDDNQEYADRNSALRFKAKCIKEFNKYEPWREDYWVQFGHEAAEAAHEEYS